MSRNIRARLDRLERQREEQPPAAVNWDALPTDWPEFLKSIGPLPGPAPEVVRGRERLAQLCTVLGCTPADLGMPGHDEARRRYNPDPSGVEVPNIPNRKENLNEQRPRPILACGAAAKV